MFFGFLIPFSICGIDLASLLVMPSTVIKSHRYIQETEMLIITFISGKIYQYSGVSKVEYEVFRKAFSKGTHFNKFIKPNHPFKELIH